MNINQLTASRIKDLRSKNGLTAEAVAQSLNISRSAYSQMENGHVEITLSRIELLAQIFNVPIEEIIPSSTTNHQTYTGNNASINGNNNANNSNTFNNFFAQNEEIIELLTQKIREVVQGK